MADKGGLYPSIAVSDGFNAVAHAAAASLAFNAFPDQPAWLGFTLVSTAAFAGTLRFGLSASMFAQANQDLAGLAAYIGLPLIGYTFGAVGGLFAPVHPPTLLALALAGGFIAAIARSLPEDVGEVLQVLLNIFLFIIPVMWYGWSKGDWPLVGAVILFAVAGVVVGPDRHRRLLGVRREDWFHYMISIASYIMACSLASKH